MTHDCYLTDTNASFAYPGEAFHMNIYRGLSCLLLSFSFLACSSSPLGEGKLLATIPVWLTLEGAPTFSTDGQLLAYQAKHADGSYVVLIDGKESEHFDHVGTFRVGADGKTFIYRARKKNAFFWVVRDQQYPLLTESQFPEVSPDGKTIIAWTIKDRKLFLDSGDKQSGPFDDGGDLRMSKDGTVSYWAKKEDKFFIFVGDTSIEIPSQPKTLHISPEGKLVCYTVTKDGKEMVVIGDKAGPLFDEIKDVTVSDNATFVVYSASLGGKWFVVAGDKQSETLGRPGKPSISNDGKLVSYNSATQKEVFMTIADKTSEGFDRIGDIDYSKDGSVVAYLGDGLLFVGDTQLKTQGIPEELEVSADGKVVAYVETVDDKKFVVMGEKRFEAPDLSSYSLTLSPDARVASYVLSKNKKNYIAVNGKKSEAFDAVWGPYILYDGPVGYGVLKGQEIWWKNVLAQP
jgi:roadblock/LC7 domain-containing protein